MELPLDQLEPGIRQRLSKCLSHLGELLKGLPKQRIIAELQLQNR